MSTVTLEKRKLKASIAMTIVLISWAMFFASLFMTYAVYRSNSLVWPPMGMGDISILIPTISTIAIFISSFTYYKFEKGMNVLWLNFTTLLGLIFLGTQVALWNQLKSLGIFSGTGIYASILYGFTWTHAAHIVLALLGLGWVYFSYYKNNGNESVILITNIGKFWHFLTIIWALMFGALFLF